MHAEVLADPCAPITAGQHEMVQVEVAMVEAIGVQQSRDAGDVADESSMDARPLSIRERREFLRQFIEVHEAGEFAGDDERFEFGGEAAAHAEADRLDRGHAELFAASDGVELGFGGERGPAAARGVLDDLAPRRLAVGLHEARLAADGRADHAAILLRAEHLALKPEDELELAAFGHVRAKRIIQPEHRGSVGNWDFGLGILDLAGQGANLAHVTVGYLAENGRGRRRRIQNPESKIQIRYDRRPVQPAIFLDRDNTLIANDGDLGDPAAVRIIDGVGPGLRALRDAGYRLVVVSNQAGVARGRFTEEDVDTVHQRIATLIEEQAGRGESDAAAIAPGGGGLIDRFYYCPYHPEATLPDYRRDHPWRKPHPGMILQAARDMGLDLSRSWMIGDQERDVLAGKAAGCRTVLFSRDAELAQRIKPTDAATTFGEVVKIILQHRAGSASTSPALHQPVPQPAPQPVKAAVPAANAPAAGRTPEGDAGVAGIRRAVNELTEAIRDDRLRRVEFRFVTMLAGLCQLLALTLGLLGLLQLDSFEVFAKWMLGAALMQMLTMTLLLLDLRG